MGRSPRFGSVQRNSTPISDSLSLRLRLSALTLLHKTTRRLIKQKAHRHTFPLRGIVLRPLVSAWFQVLLTQLIAVLFIVQSPYLSTIGHRGIFSLGRWAARLHTRFHESRATLVRLSTGTYRCRIRDFHPLWSAFQSVPLGSVL